MVKEIKSMKKNEVFSFLIYQMEKQAEVLASQVATKSQ
jgi:hypothetical protein